MNVSSVVDRFKTALEAVSAGVGFATPETLAAEVARLVGEGVVSATADATTTVPEAVGAADVVGSGVTPATPNRPASVGPSVLTVAVDPRLVGLASDLQAQGIMAVEAHDRSSVALADVQVGITPACAAIAESGTVIVGPGDGVEGLLAVLPHHHIVIAPADVIEPDLPAALARLAPDMAKAGSRLVFVSGPSRTSDIEVVPVLGVHGPLRLDVVIVGPGTLHPGGDC
jgi:hypothetical protein